MKTKPFNLEEALANPDRVICRDGVKPDAKYYPEVEQWVFTRPGKTGIWIAYRDGHVNYDHSPSVSDLLLTCETKLVPFTYETFLPHRDRWVTHKLLEGRYRVAFYGETVWLPCSPMMEWSELLQRFTFEDGTPCGVEVEE